MNPYILKGIIGLVIVAVIFGVGFQVATWKWSGKVEKAVAAREAAEKESRTDKVLADACIKDMAEVKLELEAKAEAMEEANRLYEEAVNAPPEVVVRYRDRVRTVTEVIQSEDCQQGVAELFTFLHSLPERPQ